MTVVQGVTHFHSNVSKPLDITVIFSILSFVQRVTSKNFQGVHDIQNLACHQCRVGVQF